MSSEVPLSGKALPGHKHTKTWRYYSDRKAAVITPYSLVPKLSKHVLPF